VSRDRVYLIYIGECIANVEELTAPGREAFMATRHEQAAVLYYLQTMAEATQQLSDELKTGHPEIDWEAIGGFRNRLVHGYLDVNMAIVWNVIENYLQPLKQAVETMLAGLDASESSNG
jgi:uncharacterized protein with HEPN domain